MKKRIFETGAADSGSVYAIGNGRVMAYGHGPEWFQAFGPVYSSPNVLSLTIAEGESVFCESSRLPGSGAWTHAMRQGTMTDCAPREICCLARHFDCASPVRLRLRLENCERIALDGEFPAARIALLLRIPAGSMAYNRYPTPKDQQLILLARGVVDVHAAADGYDLMPRGQGELLLIGGRDYSDVFENAARVYRTDWAALYEHAMSEDAAFTARRLTRQSPLRDHPLRKDVEEAADDVAFLIRAQQSYDGGVQAGHNYHLAYVRDQYGVFRGLLALGCFEEAEAMMRYYASVFARWGFIANAQSMGHFGIFHVHEEDRAEITGYLVLQTMQLLDVTGNRALFDELRPMMKWALCAQAEALHAGMLPFNGDETYIAGGLVPRTVMWHGSLEATMLMITGGERYLSWCRAEGVCEPWMDDIAEKIKGARRLFEANFRRGDRWVANCAARLDGFHAPKVRHGVCLRCRSFGWTHRIDETDQSVYLCARCLPHKREMATPSREEMSVKSVIMMHPYSGADVLPRAYIHREIQSYLEEYRKTGVLPSLPSGSQCLGYDFGLLLYAARAEKLDADDLLEHMLSVRDDSGAWVEYYDDNRPLNTRCRPWESGINIEGALAYLRD